MRRWIGHVDDAWLEAFQDGTLDAQEQQKLLGHVAECGSCAEKLADCLEAVPFHPPAYLADEILELSRSADIQTRFAMRRISRRVRLFLYSLKVGAAVATSLWLLAVAAKVGRLEGQMGNPEGQGVPQMSVTEKLDKGSSLAGDYLRELADRMPHEESEEVEDD